MTERDFKSVRVKSARCPRCGKILTGAIETNGAGHTPKPGDLTVCVACHQPCEWSPDMSLQICDLKSLQPEDRAELESAIRTLERIRPSYTS